VKLQLSKLLAERDRPLATRATSSGLRSADATDLRQCLTGILPDYGITRVAHLTGFDHIGLPVHMAVKPQGRSLSSGSGKGTSTDASWVSAVMECCEQSVWENLALDSVHASQDEMHRNGEITVDATRCVQTSRTLWAPHVPVRWTLATDIVSGDDVWVPEALVTVQASGDGAYRPFVSGSNGLASGRHVLEAVLSGLLEVIERDGMTLTTHVTQRRHLDGLERLREVEPSVADKLDASGLQLEVVDATTEIGVPVVVAYLHDRPGGSTGSFKGAGASLSSSTALVRAVTEAAQGRCLIVAGARDDIFESQRAAATSTRVAPIVGTEGVFTNRTELGSESIEEDLEKTVSLLVASGFNQILVLRHTAPDEVVQVVRVIVPGLEGYMFSYAGLGVRGRSWRDSNDLEAS